MFSCWIHAESSKARAGSTLSDAERIKLDIKSKVPESKITYVWLEVTDTNVGLWNYEEFKGRTSAEDPPLVTRRMKESSLSHVAGFPSMVQCYELVLECARHYDQDTQRIIGPQGRIIANLNPVSIAQTFNMPNRSHVEGFTIEAAQKYYDDQTVKS